MPCPWLAMVQVQQALTERVIIGWSKTAGALIGASMAAAEPDGSSLRMGRQRTANIGVSIYGTGHNVEKKKRKASDISIFDHVDQRQLAEQALQQSAPALAPAPAPAPVNAPAPAPSARVGADLPPSVSMAAFPPSTSAALPPSALANSMAAAAGVRVPMLRHMQPHARQQLVGLPMRRTRSQQARELAALMKAPWPRPRPRSPNAPCSRRRRCRCKRR